MTGDGAPDECPLCGGDPERWEYGYKCPDDTCPAEQLRLHDRPGAITVAVDPDEWSERDGQTAGARPRRE
jgi:hypothetical protein